MSENHEAGESSNGCIKVFLITGGITLLSIILLVFIGLLNWNRIREHKFFQPLFDIGERFSDESEDLIYLREHINNTYPGQQVEVKIHSHTSTSEAAQIGLSIEIINPAFADSDGHYNFRVIAHDIALEAARVYPHIDDYDFIAVKIAEQKGGFITTTRSASFTFSVSELSSNSGEE